MARVQIESPQTWLFHTKLTVRVGDINYGGHLGNDRVLGLAHEARVRWLASHNFSEADVSGAGLIMADAALVFRREAFWAMFWTWLWARRRCGGRASTLFIF